MGLLILEKLKVILLLKIFEDLIKLNPNNYTKIKINEVDYYAIYIFSNDENRDNDSQELLNLVAPFKMQDCHEGFVSIKEYYLKKILGDFYSREDASIPETEIIAIVKKNLGASGNLDLLDLERGIVYKNRFYRDAHLKCLKLQQKDRKDSQEQDL